jgi:hypothetical protein
VRTFAQTVAAVAERVGDVPLQIAAAASYLSGDYRATEHLCLNLMQSLHDQQTREADLLERAVAQYREWNITSHASIAMASLGYVYACSGRIAEGVSCLQQALTAYEGARIGYYPHIFDLTAERIAP